MNGPSQETSSLNQSSPEFHSGGKSSRGARLRHGVEIASIVVGALLVLVVTLAVTFMKPEREPMQPGEAEARKHLMTIYQSQKMHLRENGSYTSDFEKLKIESSKGDFNYRIMVGSKSGTYAAYAMWKDKAKRPRRFLRINHQGRITKTGSANRRPRKSDVGKQEAPKKAIQQKEPVAAEPLKKTAP